jgi:hypothetical protein
VTAKLTSDGRTILRGSYGRFNQGVLTGELEDFHPGTSPVTIRAFEQATGAYTRVLSMLGNRVNLLFDRDIAAPRTDQLSVGVDRELARSFAVAVAYVRKHGSHFIGWTETGGQYVADTRPLSDGSPFPVQVLTNGNAARRFLLTNPENYSLTYNGLVLAAEERRSPGWHIQGSYTFSRTYGLQASSGTTAAGAQASTVSPPQPLTFGRDPNDLTNARGRLPNDRPHVFRAMGSFEESHTGVLFAANLQHFSGKPWAATGIVQLPQNNQQRVLLEPRGSQRLPSQSLLDVRVSKKFAFGDRARLELTFDVLNALNDTATEALVTDHRFSPSFAQPAIFIDPRRAMIGVRVDFGR